MNTKIYQLNSAGADDEAAFREAGRILQSGGLVAFPTETVYGLGGNGLDPAAARKIYAAKGRPSDNPLILHIASRGELDPLVEHVPEAARRLMDAYWPGPLTLIFQKSSLVPHETTGGLDTVAVRMPEHEAARRLIAAAGVPVAAPSANLSGRPSPTTASHVIEDMNGRIEMILDGGDCRIGLESTIIDVTGDYPVVLRPGFIGHAELDRLFGRVEDDPALHAGGDLKARPKAPGMKYRHYAPQASVTIVEGASGPLVAERIRQLATEEIRQGKRVCVLCGTDTLPAYEGFPTVCVGNRSCDETIAHELFRVLRGFDENGVECVFSESFEGGAHGEAIMNRLRKAAGYHIVQVRDEDGKV